MENVWVPNIEVMSVTQTLLADHLQVEYCLIHMSNYSNMDTKCLKKQAEPKFSGSQVFSDQSVYHTTLFM